MNTLKLEAIKNSGKSMEIIVLFAIIKKEGKNK